MPDGKHDENDLRPEAERTGEAPEQVDRPEVNAGASAGGGHPPFNNPNVRHIKHDTAKSAIND